ncbi:hypothetical protein ACFQ21_00310 [Ohtaekwangia kribbensis]|uniref:Integrase catalytic domain-containing protein n=1 Tax=Ohtaekwangia kribbensis TaxID=688913 RepID=A0ABW3JUV3_9BACT
MPLLEGNKIWLFVPELDNSTVGVSLGYIKKKVSESRKLSRPTWKSKKHDLDKRIILIDYDSLPETTKVKLPSRADLIKLSQADTTEVQLNKLQDACDQLADLHSKYTFISDYHFFLKRTESQVKAEDLKQAAGWLRLLNAYKTPKETRTINFNSKAEFRTAVLNKLIENFRAAKAHLYGFKITNLAVLQRKELEWAKAYKEALELYFNEPKIEAERQANEAALGTLIHENFGNNHRRVLGRLNDNEAERILLPSGRIDFSEWNARTLVYLFMNPGKANKFDFENIYRRYQFECKKAGRKPEVEISAIKDFLTSNEVNLYTKRERHGWAEFDKMAPHVYGKEYEYSFSKGGYDGFQVDFNSKIEGKQLMLTVVAVFDYMSEAITGFDVGFVEDGLMVRNMYRNHLNMFEGRSYIEIESDRFSGNLAEDTTQIFSKTCQKISRPIPNDPQGKASNPKSRFVERLLQELNRLAQNFPGWKGTNITSIDKNRKPNPDYRNGNYVEGYAESVKQIIELINIYNHDKYGRTKSRWEKCIENINPKAPAIPRESISMLLNQSTMIAVRNARISFEVNRREYHYAFPEYDQYVHMMEKGYRVKVYFDETDMNTIDVFGENDQYIATLGKTKRVARAKAEQTPEDLKQLGKMTNDRKQFVERVQSVSRKMLEFEASQLGIDISNMSLQDAQEVIAGMKEISPEELFEDALATSYAAQSTDYYQDRLIRSKDIAVPASKKEKKGLDDERRALVREQAKRNGLI